MEKNPADFDVRSADSPKNEALNYALRVLSASPKSRHQLKEKMLTKGFAESLTESVLGRLEAAGYINDQALAEGLVHRMASSRKGYGKRRAAFELKRRGFGPDTAERALEGLSPSQEEEAALSLARLVWEKSAKLPEPKRKKKVFDTVMRRGYSFSLAKKTAETVSRDHEGGDSDDFSEEFE